MSESSLSSEYVLDISDLKFRWSKHSPLMHMDSLQVQKGEKVFLKGESGSGKSTLLSLIGGVSEPDSGVLKVLGQDLAKMTAKQRDLFRAEHLGLIFQQFNLIPYLTSIDNVLLTGRFSKHRRIQPSGAIALLEKLGLDQSLLGKSVTQLSIGQQQRVAAARALAGKPSLIIADEPTSALDENTRDAYLQLLFEQCDDNNATLLFVSHDKHLASQFDRQLNVSELISWHTSKEGV